MALNDETEVVFKSARTDVDPVSGNDVPPGSLPEEVRDDIPAMLSEGEYVVPADVLRYYGMKFFEDLREQAKIGLSEMESEGRIGGEPIEEETGSTTLSDVDIDQIMSEVPMEDVDPQMSAAFGGYVGFQEGGFPEYLSPPVNSIGLDYKRYTDGNVTITIPFFNNEPMGVVPEGYYLEGETPKDAQQDESKTKESKDPVNQELKKRVLDRVEEKEDPVDFTNLDNIQSAIGDYHSASPLKAALMSGPFLPLTYALGSKSKKDEKDFLLKGIEEQLNSPLATPELKKLENYKKQLLDENLYEESITKEGEKLGIVDRLFSGIKGSLTPEDIGKVKERYNNSSDNASKAWQEATTLKNSMHPKDDPVAYHKAIKAQSEASRAFTALKRAETAKKKAEQGDDYTPSGAPDPTKKYSKTVQDREKEDKK